MTRELAIEIADDWDKAADICEAHEDLTGAAAFRTCANRLRRVFGLSENDPWREP